MKLNQRIGFLNVYLKFRGHLPIRKLICKITHKALFIKKYERFSNTSKIQSFGRFLRQSFKAKKCCGTS